ncbi:hypothetical protein AAFF_G00274790 [Aldrovandia affinis]|uniref:Uncharacterized protein n=1 Tax=Aldrovandia affinis TaxID=143900 RepID=A0AAD7WSH8_9TELE|nr:hypothetical protein AAFF_G00274790 [Aldrovandia affinis]
MLALKREGGNEQRPMTRQGKRRPRWSPPTSSSHPYGLLGGGRSGDRRPYPGSLVVPVADDRRAQGQAAGEGWNRRHRQRGRWRLQLVARKATAGLAPSRAPGGRGAASEPAGAAGPWVILPGPFVAVQGLQRQQKVAMSRQVSCLLCSGRPQRSRAPAGGWRDGG